MAFNDGHMVGLLLELSNLMLESSHPLFYHLHSGAAGLCWSLPLAHNAIGRNTSWKDRQSITGYKHHSLSHPHLRAVKSLQAISQYPIGLWGKPEFQRKSMQTGIKDQNLLAVRQHHSLQIHCVTGQN